MAIVTADSKKPKVYSYYLPLIYAVDRNNNREQKFGLPEYEAPPPVEETSAEQPDLAPKPEIKNHILYPNLFSLNSNGVNDSAKIRFKIKE